MGTTNKKNDTKGNELTCKKLSAYVSEYDRKAKLTDEQKADRLEQNSMGSTIGMLGDVIKRMTPDDDTDDGFDGMNALERLMFEKAEDIVRTLKASVSERKAASERRITRHVAVGDAVQIFGESRGYDGVASKVIAVDGDKALAFWLKRSKWGSSTRHFVVIPSSYTLAAYNADVPAESVSLSASTRDSGAFEALALGGSWMDLLKKVTRRAIEKEAKEQREFNARIEENHRRYEEKKANEKKAGN